MNSLWWIDGRVTDRLALTALCGTVAGSVLAIGAVHPVSIALTLGLAVLGASLVIWRNGPGDALPLAAVFAGLAAFSAFQAIPLPASWVAAVAPANAAVWHDALAGVGLLGPTRHPISLDPDATWVEVARHLTYACVFILAVRVAAAFERQTLVLVLFATTLLVALVTIAHGVLALKSVYGVYQPRYATPIWLSPLLNTNNLAGYLNLGFFCGVTLIISRRQPIPVPLLTLGTALLAGVMVLSGSRGALLAFLVTLAALAVLMRRKLIARAPRGLWKPLLAVALATLAIVAFSAREKTLTAYEETNTKLKLFGWVLDMIAAHPWLGVGRGAFEVAFPAFRGNSIDGGDNNIVFAHAECWPLQCLVEWGIPATVVALASLVAAVRPWSRSFARGSLMVVAGGIVALTAQNLVDVAFEVPAVCIALVVALAAVLPEGHRRSRRAAPPMWPRVLAPAALLIGLVVAATTWNRSTVTSSRDTMFAALQSTDFRVSTQAQAFNADLHRELLRRPGEPYLNVLGALAARKQARADAALRWISHALDLDPTRSDSYFVLGRILVQHRHVLQGFEAMRRAIDIQPNLYKRVAREAFRASKDPELLVRVAPHNERGTLVLLEIAKWLKSREKQQFLEAAVARHPNNTDILAAQVDSQLQAIENAAARCGEERRSACLFDVRLNIERLEHVKFDVTLLRARFLDASGDTAAASRLLAEKCPGTTVKVECQKLQAQVAAKSATNEAFQAVVAEYLRTACGETDDCGGAERMVGDLFVQRKEWTAALLHLERAAKSGGGAKGWRRYAEVSRLAGADARAADALRKAERYAEP